MVPRLLDAAWRILIAKIRAPLSGILRQDLSIGTVNTWMKKEI